tara:strand:+ start:374 stop:640 length:267 start_codon:yes stop_codon:yes gene_type:complete
MKPTPRQAKQIHEKYEKVKEHLIYEKYAIDDASADKIISGMSQEWFDTIIVEDEASLESKGRNRASKKFQEKDHKKFMDSVTYDKGTK